MRKKLFLLLIEITKKGVKIKGATETALLRAVQTMDQIMMGDYINSSKGEIHNLVIDDKPRYEYRAIMLDPARHFIPVKDVKFFIDQIAKYKYNILQLHLTDDQGWRVEIKSHPQLTTVGAFRSNTPKEIGSTTNMMICACSEEAYSIYADIFNEIAAIFPS